jgi:prevent-host-death family protein
VIVTLGYFGQKFWPKVCKMNQRHEVAASEAKARLSELLDLVEQGDSIVITRHGKPVAELGGTAEARLERKNKIIEGFTELRARIKPVPLDEILAARHEGRKY